MPPSGCRAAVRSSLAGARCAAPPAVSRQWHGRPPRRGPLLARWRSLRCSPGCQPAMARPASAPRSAPRSLALAAMLPRLSAGGHRLLLAAPPDAGLDEAVDVAVEDRGGVAGLLLGPQVLDHLVRVQHVGAHLVAPAAALSLERVHLGPLLLLPAGQQPGLQHTHGGGAVLDLALLALAGHHEAGGQGGGPAGGVGRVHALPAGAGGPADADPDVVIPELDAFRALH